MTPATTTVHDRITATLALIPMETAAELEALVLLEEFRRRCFVAANVHGGDRAACDRVIESNRAELLDRLLGLVDVDPDQDRLLSEQPAAEGGAR